MKKTLAAISAVAVLAAAAGSAQAAPSRTQVGLLTCEVAPGIGFVIGSDKDVSCTFKRKGYKTEYYEGTLKKFGFDVGFTARSDIAWLVFAATDRPYTRHALAGTYVGASQEATLGVGLGSNWLVGGSRKAFSLQPFSIQGQVGVNLSLTWTGLTLR